MLQLLIPSFQSLSVTRLSMRVSSLVLIIVSLVAPAFGDDFTKLKDIFTSSVEHAGLVTIPPGDYELDGTKPLPLASHMTVTAYGARFHLPTKLGDKARVVLFAGNNVSDFRWFGGHFSGNVFDPSQPANSWEPNANTRAILITTSASERTENLTFRDITSDGVAGAVITVLGGEKKGSDREIETYARNVTIENCTLTRSGKFMWDYGYLWQITVWPESNYFRNDLIRGPSGPHATHAITFAPGGDTLLVTDNIFRGSARTIGPLNGCEKVTIRDNAGIESPETRCENRRIRVHVPSAAKGFVMHAPDVNLEDVGTEFAMNVKAQKNAVHLYDGEVIAHTKDKAPESLKVGMSLASTTAGVSPQDFFPNNDLEGLIQQRERRRFQQWQTWSQEIRKDLPLIAYDSFLHAPDDRWDRLISNFADPQQKQRTSGAVGAQWTQGRWQSIAVSYDNQSGRVLQYFDGFEIRREVSKNPHHPGPLRDRQSESAHGKSSLLFSHPQWKRRDRSVHHLQHDPQRCGDPIPL